jgi:hypothetical protein
MPRTVSIAGDSPATGVDAVDRASCSPDSIGFDRRPRIPYSEAMPADRAPMPLSQRARWALAASAAVTLGLYLVPYGEYAVYPLLLISTLVHELGHGVAAVMAGADFLSFEMWPNGSGVAAHTQPSSDAARAFISAGGLCGPAVAAAAMIAIAPRPNWARVVLGGFGLALVVAMGLVVRNGFGLAFTGVLAAVAILIAWRGGAQLAQCTLLFLAVQLALSVFSRGDYLFMQWASIGNETERMPSDSQQMAEAMGGVYWFWGGICAAFSMAMLLIGAWMFWRGTSRSPVPRAGPRSRSTR